MSNIQEVLVSKVGPGDYWVDGWHVVKTPSGSWSASRTCACPQHRERHFMSFRLAKNWIGDMP